MPSVTQMLPSKSTCRPCGNTNKPAPNALTSLPDASNLRIGSRFDPSQLNIWPSRICDAGMNPCAAQRSATQMLLPSGSMSTAAVEPQMRPSAILAQLSMGRYGLGPEFVGATAWDRACVPTIASTAATIDASEWAKRG